MRKEDGGRFWTGRFAARAFLCESRLKNQVELLPCDCEDYLNFDKHMLAHLALLVAGIGLLSWTKAGHEHTHFEPPAEVGALRLITITVPCPWKTGAGNSNSDKF